MTAWTEQDKVGLREYLGSPSGKNLLATLRSSIPRAEGESFEKVALYAKLKQGWEDCILTIIANSQEEPQQAQKSEFTDTSAGLQR